MWQLLWCVLSMISQPQWWLLSWVVLPFFQWGLTPLGKKRKHKCIFFVQYIFHTYLHMCSMHVVNKNMYGRRRSLYTYYEWGSKLQHGLSREAKMINGQCLHDNGLERLEFILRAFAAASQVCYVQNGTTTTLVPCTINVCANMVTWFMESLVIFHPWGSLHYKAGRQ